MGGPQHQMLGSGFNYGGDFNNGGGQHQSHHNNNQHNRGMISQHQHSMSSSQGSGINHHMNSNMDVGKPGSGKMYS